MGGYPSTTNAYVFMRETDILERNGRSQMIEDVTEVEGREELLQLRQENFVQNGADVYAVRWTGGGGFGDPFDRLPEDIDADLEAFAVTPEAAVDIYGAVLDADGRVDAAATAQRRAELRAAFVAKHGAKGRVREGSLLCEASVNLHVKRDAAGSYWACAKCSADLGATTANYKDACLREDLPVSASNPLIGDPARFIDDAVSFRRFHCPCCGAQIDNEIAVSRDPILADIHVAA
jgi:N-methylhydantoinase B